ncbi:MAG: 1,4-alpha-glucan branching protein GlgB [Caldimonas sp.]
MPSEQAIYLFREGTNARVYDDLGCHLTDGAARFAVWAPNATAVAVIGAWSSWDAAAHPLTRRGDGSGIWEGNVAGVKRGDLYKFRIVAGDGRMLEKADPLAFCAELPPATASRAWTLEYDWGDGEWMAARAGRNGLGAPLSIYEVHLGSWRRDHGRILGYRELAPLLADYALEMGFTHVELMPITEHPFYGSWGYQTTGYFAPTTRYGTPQDFMAFVDHLHQRGIGVLLDWVPSHFPTDAHGLAEFDGTHLFEHADPRQGFHPEWNSAIFNYGRDEVRSFLISSGCFWLDKYHLDGLRVDAVASMLYLDYARKSGEWVPNPQGGKENLDAVAFLRGLNEAVYRDHPDTMTIAEESTAWPMVSRPTSMGGLGFGMKWNMGWMHDTLAYLSQDPIHRRHHHGGLTFSIDYAFNENFVLPLSHDEVVHGKGSLLGKMPGDEWRRFANLRALFGLMWTHPGKKLLFMGGEIAQGREWTHEGQLEWQAAELPSHAGVQRLVADLNRLYRAEPALHELDFSPDGFEWVESHDAPNSVIAYLRKPAGTGVPLLVVANLTPVQREGYRVGVPRAGFWRELLNSDAVGYGGSGAGNLGGVASAAVVAQGRPHSLSLTLPALSVLVLRGDAP